MAEPTAYIAKRHELAAEERRYRKSIDTKAREQAVDNLARQESFENYFCPLVIRAGGIASLETSALAAGRDYLRWKYPQGSNRPRHATRAAEVKSRESFEASLSQFIKGAIDDGRIGLVVAKAGRDFLYWQHPQLPATPRKPDAPNSKPQGELLHVGQLLYNLHRQKIARTSPRNRIDKYADELLERELTRREDRGVKTIYSNEVKKIQIDALNTILETELDRRIKENQAKLAEINALRAQSKSSRPAFPLQAQHAGAR